MEHPYLLPTVRSGEDWLPSDMNFGELLFEYRRWVDTLESWPNCTLWAVGVRRIRGEVGSGACPEVTSCGRHTRV